LQETHAAPSLTAQQLPPEIQALIQASRDVLDHHGTHDLNPESRAFTAMQSLWDQGYIVTRSITSLKRSLAGLLTAGTLGFALHADLGMGRELALPSTIAAWILGVSAGLIARGLQQR
jgi:hypothetical protein